MCVYAYDFLFLFFFVSFSPALTLPLCVLSTVISKLLRTVQNGKGARPNRRTAIVTKQLPKLTIFTPFLCFSPLSFTSAMPFAVIVIILFFILFPCVTQNKNSFACRFVFSFLFSLSTNRRHFVSSIYFLCVFFFQTIRIAINVFVR